ncbi:GntR family transcriptional regulator [Oxalobacteraceae bacterium]|nr:GntR family transcriptional regulator [Oxalobacteraceae bacterium]
MTDLTALPAAEALVESADSIARDIADAIAEHRLPPGTKLREEALARTYGVSRTKVRAALLMLSMEKLIDMVPDKGAYVAKPSAVEAREIFAVRRILEAALAREFVLKAKPADYKRLRAHLAAERAALAANTSRRRSRLLGDFHVLMAETVGNGVLTATISELVARSSLITMLYQSTHDAACSSGEHDQILDLAESGKTEETVNLMLHHLEHVEAGLQFDAGGERPKRDLISALLMSNNG